MRMQLKHNVVLLLMVLALVPVSLRAQEVKAFSTIDTNAIIIGDQVAFRFGISLPDSFKVVTWPAFSDTLVQGIEVIKKMPVDTLNTKSGKEFVQQLIVTGFDSGYYQLPSVGFVFARNNDTTRHVIETDPVALKIYVPDVDTARAFKPIDGPLEEPVTFGEIVPWVGLALLVVALVLFALYFYKRRKQHKPVFGKKEKPLPPAHVVALNKLEELRLAKLWQAGKVKEYHSAITDIMRAYLERRFGFDAREMTTDEILEVLRSKPVNDQAYAKLKNVFELADLVKFAKANPLPLENDQSIFDSIDFVKETMGTLSGTGENQPERRQENNEVNVAVLNRKEEHDG